MLVTKLGQPVPLSNFIAEVNSGSAHPAQANTPGRFSSLSALENGRSVPSSRRTSYTAGESVRFHSSRDLDRTSLAFGTAVPLGRNDCQFFCISATASGVNAVLAAST